MVERLSGVIRFSKNQGATSKFQVPAGWHESSSLLRDPQFWNDSGAFCLGCVNWYTFLYVGKRICSNYSENISNYYTKFSGLGDQAPQICGLLILSMEGSTMGQLQTVVRNCASTLLWLQRQAISNSQFHSQLYVSDIL